MDVLVSVAIFLLLMLGYWIYAKNIFQEETQDFYLFPWIAFIVLALLDFINILLSEDVIWFELLAGFFILLGPLVVSCIIMIQGVRVHQEEQGIRKYIFLKLKKEWSSSSGEISLLVLGFIVMIGLVCSDYYSWSLFGQSEYTMELTLAIVTILLDIVATYGLVADIKKDAQKFEGYSWFLWLIAATIGYAWNVYSGASYTSIGSILILESGCISIWILLSIHKNRIGTKYMYQRWWLRSPFLYFFVTEL